MTESASDPISASESLLSNPTLYIAATLVIAAVFYVLAFWATGRANRSRERARENHLAAGGADISSLREPMHMFDRQTWAAGSALWIFVFAVMISSTVS